MGEEKLLRRNWTAGSRGRRAVCFPNYTKRDFKTQGVHNCHKASSIRLTIFVGCRGVVEQKNSSLKTIKQKGITKFIQTRFWEKNTVSKQGNNEVGFIWKLDEGCYFCFQGGKQHPVDVALLRCIRAALTHGKTMWAKSMAWVFSILNLRATFLSGGHST